MAERERDESIDELVTFKATIVREKFYNHESSWGTYNFSTTDDIPHFTYEQKELDFSFDDKEDTEEKNKVVKYCCLVGNMQHLEEGAMYLIKATHQEHQQYGHQYNPTSVYAMVPQTKEQQQIFLRAILNSSRIADNLLKEYPNLVNDVINGDLKTIDFNKIHGVREFTWNKVREKIINNYLISDIIAMLKPVGVTFKMIKKLIDDEPNPSLLKEKIEKNPYYITRIRGLGFKKVDEFALKIKPELLESKERTAAFTKYYFQEIGDSEGHTWISKDFLVNAISNNIPECNDFKDWLFKQDDFLFTENDKVGLKHYYEIEKRIWDIVENKISSQSFLKIEDCVIEKAIELAEKEQGFRYTSEQIRVVKKILDSPFSILTGVAGSGKSSIMRAVLLAFKLSGKVVSCCALSAMASQRISEATGFDAGTIHRTLGSQGFNGFTYNRDNHLICSAAFLDESSMVNAQLFLSWLEAVDDGTQIILGGDAKQLPPIGYGNIFADLISSLEEEYVFKLTKPMRQALESGILEDANEIRINNNPITENITPKIIHGNKKDMYYMFRDNRDTINKVAINMYLKAIESDGIDNVVIATPRRVGCINSSEEINKVIQNKLLSDEIQEICAFGKTFKLGAKVMQTQNDYNRDVFNGEVGYITKIYEQDENKKVVKYCEISFTNIITKKVKKLTYKNTELNDIELAYAMTVHKLQGAGKDTVVCIVDNTHFKLLDSTMLYTQLTRAKGRCLLVAEKSAFLKCIKTNHGRRNTWLSIIR